MKFRFILLYCIFTATLNAQIQKLYNFPPGNISLISSITSDGNNIWIATYSYLSKLNIQTGETKTYTKFNSGLPENSIRQVLTDHDGNIWAVTRLKGVARFNRYKWTVFNSSNSPLKGYAIRAAIGISGEKWFCDDKNLIKYDGAKWTIYNSSNSQLPDNFIRDITVDIWGNIWLAMSNSIVKFREGKADIYNPSNSGLPDSFVHSLATDSKGNIWAYTAKGVAFFNGKDWRVYTSQNSYFSDIYTSNFSAAGEKDGQMWFSTYNGLISFDGLNWNIFTKDNSDLPSNSITAIFVDRFNNKWIGMLNGTIVKFDNKRFTAFNSSNGVPSRSVNGVAYDRNNIVWAGSSALTRIEGRNIQTYDTSSSPGSPYILSAIAVDINNDKWAGTVTSGLYKIEGEKRSLYTTANSGLPSNGIFAIFIDKQGNKWIGTTGGLSRFDGQNWITYNNSNSGLPNNSVYAITMDSKGILWIGTAAGLARFDGSTWTVFRAGTYGLLYDRIFAVAADKQDNIWVSAGIPGIDPPSRDERDEQGQLSKFDGKSWTVYNKNSGLKENRVHAISVDSAGAVWFGTFGEALIKFDGTSFTFYKEPFYKEEFHNWISCLTTDRQGNKLFGTRLNGLFMFNENGLPPQFQDLNSIDEDFVNNYFIPANYKLEQNFPNPFNPRTRIPFHLPLSGDITLKIYDLLGREVSTVISGYREAGRYTVLFDGSSLPSGIYIYTINAYGFSDSKKFLLLK